MATQVTKRKEEEAEIDMTPMLDIVFIMLIFFIVTASFVKESGIDVLNPEALTATSRGDANIFIGISKDDEIYIDNKNIELGRLKLEIQRLRNETAEGSIVIQADQASNAGQLMKVLDAVRSAGVQNVAVAATRN